MKQKTLLLAGGGSGGHVFPLLAVAAALKELAPELNLVFVGTERGLEKELVPARGYRLELVSVLPIRGAGLGGALSGLTSAARALPASRALVRELRPSAVLSIGGYAAGPVALAAWTLGVPVALVEPNAEIGLSNRLLVPLVSRAYTAFPEAARFFRPPAVLETGVPLRPGFSAQPLGAERREARILVLGGSQGAKTLNESVPRALAALGQPVSVVHQAGSRHEAPTRELYAELGLAESARVMPFIDDMSDALARADLVIGRAGAGAVSEICAVGRPSVLIPYPYAGDHQRFNAMSLEQRGAAVTVLAKDAKPERLAQEIGSLLGDRARLSAMARQARSLGRPNAALAIARDLLALAGLAGSSARKSESEAAERAGSVRFEAREVA
jgi:UDP-N-acetylglucosamine--N-acetylmuramyl-(pentapeptide) pyrophosphoryl-undecaprenol N-acetylglucosamine transferase